MSDKQYVYGENNGASYIEEAKTSDQQDRRRTHWDPRLELMAISGTVQVGIVPPSEKSTDEGGLWDPEDGQFLSLSRDGINRTIRTLRQFRDEVYGRDE